MLLGVLGIDLGGGGTSLGRGLLLLSELGLPLLDFSDGLFSLGIPLFSGLAALSSDLFAIKALDVPNDSSRSSFLPLGSLVGLELLVESSPDDGPTDDLTLDLAVVETTGLL